MRQALPSSPVYHRVMRAAGIGIWLFLALPIFDSSTRSGESLTGGRWVAWLILFLVFGPAFWFSSSPAKRSASMRLLALLVETIATLGMTALLQDYFVGFLLVIVSWQLALVLPLQAACVWTALDSFLLIYFLEPHYHMGWRWGGTAAFLGFQVFALVTAAMANSESLAREDLARINAELASTRELLRESSKTGERLRIARELHDVLGHHLTALCLHLEAALHSSVDQARTAMEKALATSRQLLTDLRSVVSALHDTDEIDLQKALASLGENLPRIKLHVSIPSQLRITDGARAHAVLRCVQEVTTNTLKHSDASNLWITLWVEEGAIEIEAQDDGQNPADVHSGMGLSSMRRRLEELGGGLTVAPNRQSGFGLRAWLPAKSPAELQ
jgi:signal transduction histidine kinase